MNIAEISKNISQLLWEDAEELGRSTGFIKRQRKFNGSNYAQMLVCGAIGTPDLSYSHLVQYASLSGVQISAQGISERFSEEAANFLKALLDRAVQYAITERTRQVIPLLAKFKGVYMRDSSVISLPASLNELWPGVGGTDGENAAIKLQVRLEYSSGHLDGPVLHTGRTHDQKTPYRYDDEPAGSLSLADLGYFSLDELKARQNAGQYVITRYKHGTILYSDQNQRLNLLEWLQDLQEERTTLDVLVGAKHRIPMRLLVMRVPDDVAEQRRSKVREYARKKQANVRPETLELAGWVLILTNAPATLLNFDEVIVLLYLRWQIELLFKLWKSHFLIDEWRSENPWRILCELYAKLIAVVICQWIFQLDWWRYPDRSLFKAAKVVTKLAGLLLDKLQRHVSLTPVLKKIQRCITASARTNKRRKKPATFQLLLEAAYV